jgi:ATPase subunit of ABC transporter with duplicated ATPase domains
VQGRTIILVSHHVQLCSVGAAYIVALENGSVKYQGGRDGFVLSGAIKEVGQTQLEESREVATAEEAGSSQHDQSASSSTAVGPAEDAKGGKKPARKLVEDETRAVGRIDKDVWLTLFRAQGNYVYWTLFAVSFGVGTLAPVLENSWLR